MQETAALAFEEALEATGGKAVPLPV